MIVTRYNPTTQLREFRRGFDFLNSMLDDMNTTKNSHFKEDFSPLINTREDEKFYYVEVELPGVEKENISIEIEDDLLVISGERKMKKELTEDGYFKIESSFGTFSRSFSLPENVEIQKIEAVSNDGILEVKIPKKENSSVQKVKKIEIK